MAIGSPRNRLLNGALGELRLIRKDATIEEAAGREQFGVEKGGAGRAAN